MYYYIHSFLVFQTLYDVGERINWSKVNQPDMPSTQLLYLLSRI